MTLSDLLFLASVLFVAILLVCIAVSALRRRWEMTRRLSRLMGIFLALYTVALICVSLSLPRRFYPPGERRCFDDWCLTALDAAVADASVGMPCRAGQAGRVWVVKLEVSSVARRIRQRAPDARAEVEDRQGTRYQPCAAPLAEGIGPARLLSDQIGPGESYRVLLPFRLPADATPAGVVLHHGDVPGVAVIGADQSLLHRPALQRLADAPRRDGRAPQSPR
ncbi:MAG TPA: hypothetical protein VKR61_17110 [Bryobacteraceae bacterium]|nr:hypothetical protein [Bryobacteraceae bacterium]